MSDLVGNLEDWFPRDAAHMFITGRSKTMIMLLFILNGDLCLLLLVCLNCFVFLVLKIASRPPTQPERLTNIYAANNTGLIIIFCLFVFEPRCEKTGFLHMRKQRRRSASR